MILVIDNYDSFTYNIVQSLERLSEEEVCTIRSKEISSITQIEEMKPSHLVIGPGPGTPDDAGISMDAVKYFAGKIPILGICLGHQAMAQAFGAKIVQAKYIRHGVVEEIKTDGRGIFRLTGKSSSFTRYHSLVIDEETLSDDFEISARAKDGDIMGIRHKTMCLEGVQFHPESIASKGGDEIFRAFLNYRRDNLPVNDLLNTIISGTDLSEDQASRFMENLADGTLDERVTAAVLTGLACKKPAVTEIVGFAKALLKVKKPLPVEFHDNAEIVGTGGDGKGSFNISSLSALVASSCGLVVTKHGNRAVSSKSGSADFFESLGIDIMASPENTCRLVQKTGFSFLMATVYHSAMRFAAPVRKALGVKTIMNIMGPLLNPANAEYELLGVYSKELLETYAHSAKNLGAKRVLVIASEDGYDEISPCAVTYAYEIDENGNESSYEINPQDFGLKDMDENELYGGNGKENAALALEVLNGKGRRTIKAAVCLNAGALLYISKKAGTLLEGFKMAEESINNGTALKKLEEIVAVSKEINC